MDKYEYKLKLEQLKNLVAANDYMTAAEIADSINWKKVRNTTTLCMVGEIYEKTERYEACRDVLLQAYDHSPIGRNIVCKLAEVSIKAKNVEEAEEYYNEFLEVAPKDNMRYVLAYQISCLKDAPLPDRIGILEELKENEYTELWAYELAALYSQADMRDKCVETCDELILWFGDGEYVEKALDLKRRFQPLTPSQEKKYQKLREKKGIVEINIPKKAEKKDSESKQPDVSEVTVTASTFNTLNLQEELAKSMQQIMNATEKETVSDTMDSIKKIVSDIPYLNGESEEEDAPTFDQEKINKQVDQTLKKDFRELMEEESGSQPGVSQQEQKKTESPADSQMSIEDVLAEWEKTKRAAEAAIAAAEQKKLELAKTQALEEAGEIMERLKTLIPILSATPGEDLPKEEDTVAATLIPDENEKKGGKEQASEDGLLTEEIPAEEQNAEEAENKAGKEDQTGSADDLSATKEMPDLSKIRVVKNPEAADTTLSEEKEDLIEEEIAVPEEQEASAEKETAAPEKGQKASEEKETAASREEQKASVEETSVSAGGAPEESEEDLEKILAQATQMFMDNSKVEVPVSGGMNNGAVLETPDVLPEIQMPEDLLEETKPSSERTLSEGTLSEEQKELFSYFLPVPGMEEQICRILKGASQRIGNTITSLTGNILIQGEEGSGKTVLATSLIKAIQKEVGNEDAKIGKISAESLNRKDFATIVPKIAGGYLIVDKAGDLTARTAARMSQVMEQNTQGMVVVLEDTRAGIRQAMSLDFSFAKKFTEKIDIPIFTIDELVDFGKSYAEEMECIIDEMGVLALYKRINNIQKLDRATTLAEVKEIVDQAIESAEGGGIKKAFGSIFTKKYNENDYLILREKDFEN